MEALVFEFVLRSSLIAIFTAAILQALQIKSARVQHTVWTGLVAVMLALPAWSAWGPRATVHLPHSKDAAATRSSAATVRSYTAPADQPRSNLKSIDAEIKWAWQPVLGAIYFLGVLILLGRLAAGLIRARILVKRAITREGMLTSELCAAPITVGCWKPKVILPAYGWSLPAAQLDAVLIHESEHARRRDPLVQQAALLNRALFWFHPLAWWLDRRLSALAEETCDEAVLARGHDAVAYAECLLQIARMVQQAGARVNALGMAMPGAFLPQRVGRILSGASPLRPVSIVRGTCLAAACAAIAVAFTTGAVGRAQADQPARPASTWQTQEPIALLRQKDAPAPAPVRHPASKTKVLVASAQPIEQPLAASDPVAPADAYSISGTVQDPSGSRVPECTITVKDSAGATAASAMTNAIGIYQIGPLPSGSYALTYNSPGFAPFKSLADVDSGRSTTINARLTLSRSTATVEVTAPKPVNPISTGAQPTQGPVAVGGRVTPMKLLRHPEPVYPQDARQQAIEGTVLIHAVISREGIPTDLRAVNTEDIDIRLIQAALESVRRWRYQPAELNGVPVANLTTISVDFRLYP